MIDYDTYCQIQQLHCKEGLKISQVADKLCLDTRTVQRWANKEKYQARLQSKRKSKLDPFKDHILNLLDRHASYSARQIYQMIREQGFSGSYTIVKDFVARVRPKSPQAYLTLSFAPGECAQVDWGSYRAVNVGSTRRRLSFFVMVLAYSRMIYVEFTVSEKMENFLGCHINAFEYFGGSPGKIMIDNLKTAVLKHPHGKPALYHPQYADFASHYGFDPVACNVRKPNEKGRVENAVGYVKSNFLNGLEISDFKLVGPAARLWMETIANERIHGHTHKKPSELFASEKPKLIPLPQRRYDHSVTAPIKSNSCFRVIVDTNRYSVPAEYASTKLMIKRYPEHLYIYHEHKIIAEHLRSYDRHQDYENPDHVKKLLNQRQKAKYQRQLQEFLRLSDSAGTFYENMQQRALNARYHVRNILALVDSYKKEKVAEAIKRACDLQAYSSQYILNLLEQQSRFTRPAQQIQLTRHQELLEISTPHANLDLYSLNNTDS